MSRGVRYRVLRKLAHGGMAEIFLALQIGAEGFQKLVVLKRILPALAADPAFVRMLVDEAHIVSTLNHSNLVQVLDLGQAGEQFFLVLEFVDGFSLEQVRRRASKLRMKLPLPLSLHIVASLCRALDYVHRRTRDGKPLGIVHRDVTPQNVLISREGEVKLADFGIAKSAGKREKSATGVIKGKFAYMSPEQTIGAELDARSDLFSVGTLLYILTTGRKPFDAKTDLEVLMQVRRARFEKPSTFVRDFNPDVERFLVRALRSERSRRFQSAEQMADRLDKILIKLGQPTGPSVLKRWLDGLSARDGVLPPGDLREACVELPTSTIELVSGELQLQDVAPPSIRDEDDLGGDISNAKTEFATTKFSPRPQTPAEPRGAGDPATVVAHASYPRTLTTHTKDASRDPEPDKHAITIVVPSGATVIGLTPGDAEVKVRHEGLRAIEATEDDEDEDESEAWESDAPPAEPTQLHKPRLAANAERGSGDDQDLSLDVEVVSSVSALSDATRVPPSAAASAATGSPRGPRLPPEVPKDTTSKRSPVRRWLWRIGLTTLLSLVLLGGGLLAAHPYLPKGLVPSELVELVTQWLERLPPVLRGQGLLPDL